MTLVQEESIESQDLAEILKMWVNEKGNYKDKAKERILRFVLVCVCVCVCVYLWMIGMLIRTLLIRSRKMNINALVCVCVSLCVSLCVSWVLLSVFVLNILNTYALSTCRPQNNVTTISDLSYGYSSLDLARVIIFKCECKAQTGHMAHDLAALSLSSKSSVKSDEKIGIVRVGTRNRYCSSTLVIALFNHNLQASYSTEFYRFVDKMHSNDLT